MVVAGVVPSRLTHCAAAEMSVLRCRWSLWFSLPASCLDLESIVQIAEAPLEVGGAPALAELGLTDLDKMKQVGNEVGMYEDDAHETDETASSFILGNSHIIKDVTTRGEEQSCSGSRSTPTTLSLSLKRA